MICEACNITVRGNRPRCPLCGSRLIGDAGEVSAFPDLQVEETNWFWLRLSLFVTVLAALICLIVNRAATPDNWWSFFVLGGLGSFWVSMGIAFYKRRNVLKMIVWQVVIIAGLSVLWDVSTGFHRWSVNFVIPILCSVAMLAIFLIARAMGRGIREYAVYLLLDLLIGAVCCVLLLCGVLTIWLPTYLCLGLSGLMLLVLVFFRGTMLWSELRRRLHA